MDIPLDEQIYFDIITSHPTTGAVSDADSTPTFAVFEEATDTDIGVGGNLTKRTSLTGDYRGSFTASAANGFEIGKWYNVIASGTVNSIAGKAVAMRFRITAAEALAGKPKVDVDALLGTAWLTPGTAGTPDVNVNATAVTAIQSGLATASALTTVGTNVSTVLSRIGAFTGSGINTVLGFFRALMAKAAALTPSDLSSGTTFDNTTMSLQAISDGDGGLTAANIASIVSALGDRPLSIRSPVSTAGVISIVQGSTYSSATRAIAIVDENFPDLTGATATLYYKLHGTTGEGTPVVGVATEATKTCQFDVATAVSAAIAAGKTYKCSLVLSWSAGTVSDIYPLAGMVVTNKFGETD